MVFVPKAVRAIEPVRDCAKGCALTHFERSLGVLRSNADTNARAEALKIAAHLIADLHQPLNMGFAEDGGGASINGTFRGRAVTLRDMWEQELLGTILHPDSPQRLSDGLRILLTGGPSAARRRNDAPRLGQ